MVKFYRNGADRFAKLTVRCIVGINFRIGFFWAAIALAAATTGCYTTEAQRFRRPRILTSSDLEKVTAGSAGASNEIMASALGARPEATVSGTASAFTGGTPIVGMYISNYAATHGIAFARGSGTADTLLFSRLSIDHSNREAELTGVAMSSGNSRAESTTQFYGVSTKTADIAFGSVRAIACCDVTAETQVNVSSELRGSYVAEIRNRPLVNTPGERQSRLDLAVVSSTLPLLRPGQALIAPTPSWLSLKY